MNPVSWTNEGVVRVVTINNPPVNALSQPVRAGLVQAIEKSEHDPAVSAVVLIASGRSFPAGADIKEFGKPPIDPSLPEVIESLEATTKPWVAAIHGTALGGGLELALGCHYRIASDAAVVGLPEVNLGLIPGAGGTVRLPRLISAIEAAKIIADGKPINAKRAVALGMIGRRVMNDLRSEALAFANDVAGDPLPSALSRRPVKDPPEASAWKALLAKTSERARGQCSPVEAIKAVQHACTVGADQALADERKQFITLRDGAQSKALRHLFFAERRVSTFAGKEQATPFAVEQVGIVGGGTMGTGIATACLLAGLDVTLVERDDDASRKAQATVDRHLDGSLKRGLIDQQKRAEIDGRFETHEGFDALAQVDLVIEAVFEELRVKQDVFKTLDEVTQSTTILATNTSYLDVNRIAEAVVDPSRVLGLHFFSPAHVMKLLEIVHTETVSKNVLATGFALAKKLRKIAVPAGVCDGFIGNRMMAAYRQACEFMLEEGALPHEIDQAMVAFGFPMGLFAVQDLSGLDIAWARRKAKAATRDPNERYVAIGDRLCELGRFGQKAGAGWYRYEDDERRGSIDAAVTAIIAEESAKKGIERRTIAESEIMETILGVMQREGDAILKEGIAASPEAIDVVMVNGYGFPRWRGGPMYMGKTR